VTFDRFFGLLWVGIGASLIGAHVHSQSFALGVALCLIGLSDCIGHYVQKGTKK
jgi:hypothetical protein